MVSRELLDRVSHVVYGMILGDSWKALQKNVFNSYMSILMQKEKNHVALQSHDLTAIIA